VVGFSVYGTLRAAALFEQAFLYKEVYHVEDPDAAKHLEEFRNNVWLWTSEAKAKDYPFLGKFRSDTVYFYSRNDDTKQSWETIKMVPDASAAQRSCSTRLEGHEHVRKGYAGCSPRFPTPDKRARRRPEALTVIRPWRKRQ